MNQDSRIFSKLLPIKVSWLPVATELRGAGAIHGDASQNRKKLHEAAESFEALMAGFLVRSLRQSMSPGGFYGNAYGGEIYQSMMDEVLAQTLATRANLGIAAALERQFGSRDVKQTPDDAEWKSRFDHLVETAAQKTGLDANLLRAMIRQESAGDPKAVSAKGAAGLMQLMPATAALLGLRDRFDPEENIHAGARYLAGLLRRFGNLEHALAAYNAGPEAVERYGGVPAYPETEDYVARVMKIYRDLSSADTEKDSEKAGVEWK